MRYLLPVLMFLCGAGISYINYLISRKAMNTTGRGAVLSGAHFLIRQVLNIGFLVGVYFLAVKGGFNLFAMLLCAALGLTLPSFLFTFMLTKQIGSGTQNQDAAAGQANAETASQVNADTAPANPEAAPADPETESEHPAGSPANISANAPAAIEDGKEN